MPGCFLISLFTIGVKFIESAYNTLQTKQIDYDEERKNQHSLYLSGQRERITGNFFFIKIA